MTSPDPEHKGPLDLSARLKARRQAASSEKAVFRKLALPVIATAAVLVSPLPDGWPGWIRLVLAGGIGGYAAWLLWRFLARG
jgi:hypothetical protein